MNIDNLFYKLLMVFVFLLVALPITIGGELRFNYKIGSREGPEKWGDLNPEWSKCKSGLMQSPIDISPPAVTVVPQLVLLNKNYNPANALLTVDHGVAVKWQDGSAGSITFHKQITYSILNVHWHTPSEHTINANNLDLEIHMVHKNANDVAVISHLYRLGIPDPFLARLIHNIAQLNPTTNPSIDVGTMNPSEVISNGQVYYKYNGSLSTPPCSENVIWLIDQNIKTVSPEQVQTLRRAIAHSGEGNARPLQPLNKRKIESGPLEA